MKGVEIISQSIYGKPRVRGNSVMMARGKGGWRDRWRWAKVGKMGTSVIMSVIKIKKKKSKNESSDVLSAKGVTRKSLGMGKLGCHERLVLLQAIN